MAYLTALFQLTENLDKNFKLVFKIKYNDVEHEVLKCVFENDMLTSFMINKILPIDSDTINELKYRSTNDFPYLTIEEVINEIFNLMLTMKIENLDTVSLIVEFRDYDKESIIEKPLLVNFNKDEYPKIHYYEV